jgi:iron(III) transport system ATP-binding protein
VSTVAESLLMVDNVTKSFDSAPVLSGVSLQVQRGSTTAIIGSSGSGKTTLLRLIAGFSPPDSGSIRIAGKTVADRRTVIPAHRRNVGYVAQDGALFPHLTVGQNIAFGLSGRAPATRKRVAELLDMVSLEQSFSSRRPDELSGGQQQRVALARALARNPQLMLLDEPFSSLDTRLRVATRKAVANTLAQAGVTTVLVTHDQGEALSFADQVAVMRDGKLVQTGNPFSVYTRPGDRETAEFLGEAVILDADLHDSVATCCLGDIPVRGIADDGPVQLMLRPEQIRIVEDGAIRGRVLDSDYFGPETTVRIKLNDLPVAGSATDVVPGKIITVRHWDSMLATPGRELRLSVIGEGVAFPAEK